MANIDEKIQLLLQIVPIFGLASLTKYNYQIFNYKLKEDTNFLSKLNVFKSMIEAVFSVKYEVSNVDQAIKLLKFIFDSCHIQYECSRTSKSNYLKLTEPVNNNNTFQVCGNYVVKLDRIEYKSNPSNTLLIQLVAQSFYFKNEYACGLQQLAPIKWDDNTIDFASNGDYDKYIAVIFDLIAPIDQNTNLIDSVKLAHINQAGWCNDGSYLNYKCITVYSYNNKLIVIYEAMFPYELEHNNIPIRIISSAGYNDAGVKSIEVLSCTCVFDTLPRRTGFIEKKYDSYISTVSKTINNEKQILVLNNTDLTDIHHLKAIWFDNKIISAKITLNDYSISYNESQLEFMRALAPNICQHKSVILFSLDGDLGKSSLNLCRFDKIQIDVKFKDIGCKNIYFETYDKYIDEKCTPNEISVLGTTFQSPFVSTTIEEQSKPDIIMLSDDIILACCNNTLSIKTKDNSHYIPFKFITIKDTEIHVCIMDNKISMIIHCSNNILQQIHKMITI